MVNHCLLSHRCLFLHQEKRKRMKFKVIILFFLPALSLLNKYTKIIIRAYGSFHAKSTHFRLISDLTDSDFDEIWCVELLSRIIFDFLDQHGPNYGSVNFERNGPTRFGETLISPLVSDLETSALYQIKDI